MFICVQKEINNQVQAIMTKTLEQLNIEFSITKLDIVIEYGNKKCTIDITKAFDYQENMYDSRRIFRFRICHSLYDRLSWFLDK